MTFFVWACLSCPPRVCPSLAGSANQPRTRTQKEIAHLTWSEQNLPFANRVQAFFSS
jgi:hypothetical protein